MKQAGFFDFSDPHAKLVKTRDFLDRVNKVVDWEIFWPVLDKALARNDGSKGGRPAYDAVLMFKVFALQALYNLSDELTEYQILDRLSFMRFLGLELHDAVPDARTLWVFREKLIEAKAVEKLFAQFDAILNESGFEASGGQIIDATLAFARAGLFVEVPRQRNGRDDNDTIKKGEVPADWSDQKKAHKDKDARWTKKNGTAFYGYKNHVNADRNHKLIRKFKITGASVHDSRVLDNILDPNNACQNVWADSAYRSEEQETSLQEQGRTSHIHERAYRNKPLTPEQEAENTERFRVRVRVEHIFGHNETAMNGCNVRTVGFARANAKIGMETLAYNISRFSFLMHDGNTPSASI
jgi:IS5 family transposase